MKRADLDKGIDISKIIEVDMTGKESVTIELTESQAEDLKKIKIRIWSGEVDHLRKRGMILIVDSSSLPVVPEAGIIPSFEITRPFLKNVVAIQKRTVEEMQETIRELQIELDQYNHNPVIHAVCEKFFDILEQKKKGFE